MQTEQAQLEVVRRAMAEAVAQMLRMTSDGTAQITEINVEFAVGTRVTNRQRFRHTFKVDAETSAAIAALLLPKVRQ